MTKLPGSTASESQRWGQAKPHESLAEEHPMLDATDLSKMASVGFGDPPNSRARSMDQFQGRLYVGTSRDNLWTHASMGKFSHLDP